MLSYQHAYHAGNFADVVKHITLCLICDYMTQKDKPLFYLETHSGRGMYDLRQAITNKTAEYKQGVALLWDAQQTLPEPFKPWLTILNHYNDNQLCYYPGSPVFALHSLRNIDRFDFCELHPQEFNHLQQIPNKHKRVRFHFEDGMKHMNAVLPSAEKRGLIFIDPAYELKQEYEQVPKMIQTVFKKFQTGVYGLWYPITAQKHHLKLNQIMSEFPCDSKLHIQFSCKIGEDLGMNGCGLWILNPPYLLEEQMNVVISILNQYF